MKLRTLVVALALMGCRTPVGSAPPGPAKVIGQAVTVRPLAFADDAHRPDRALILGTGAEGGATIVPLAVGELRVTVDSLYVRTGVTPIVGSIGKVTLTAGPNPDGQVRVGIFENVAGGLGPSWRTGVWMASLVAADVLGKDLTDLTFTAAANGKVDGASASGLMAAGFVAALLGKPIAVDATMTGTINPDGTIGPVGGIPQKFEAAMAQGKKRLGYPIGMRRAVDLQTGLEVDLVELARAHGAEAFEIADVYAALELLTGTRLPRPVPVDASAMALPAEVDAALAVQYAHWQALLADDWPRVLGLATSRAEPAAIAQLARDAQDDLAQAERARTAGNRAAALMLITRAWSAAAAATATVDVLDAVKRGDLPGALAQLDDAEGLGDATDAALAALGRTPPDSMGGHLQLISAFQHAIAGWGYRSLAVDRFAVARAALLALVDATPAVKASAATTATVSAATLPALDAMARAVVASARAAASLEIEASASIDYQCSLPNVRRLARSFTAAAGSNLAYLDALFVDELAKGLHVDFAAARDNFAAHEPSYLIALLAANVGIAPGLPAELRATWGEDSIGWGLLTLAASELSYGRTSGLVNAHYALAVQPGLDGRPVGVVHEAAFAHMLTRAERRAREQAHAAQVATGAIPVQARLYYQLAQHQRAGSVADRLDALESYWTATAMAWTAVALARN